MSGSVNKVILVGNLGRDPEIRTLNSGDKVANFSIATSETWRDRNSGERRERTGGVGFRRPGGEMPVSGSGPRAASRDWPTTTGIKSTRGTGHRAVATNPTRTVW